MNYDLSMVMRESKDDDFNSEDYLEHWVNVADGIEYYDLFTIIYGVDGQPEIC